MFVRRLNGETLFIGRAPRLRQEVARAEIGGLLEAEGGGALLRTALADEISPTAVERMSPDKLADVLADGIARGRFVLIGYRPRPAAAPPFAESAAPENEPPPPEEAKKEEEHWLEIELLDSGTPPQPVAGAKYVVELGDGTIVEGTLDEKGKARVVGITKSSPAKVSFPEIDAGEWK